MQPLTLQEVVERINKTHSYVTDRRVLDEGVTDQRHRPEFYIPRITRRLARIFFSVSPSDNPGVSV
jgi:hypothetical protein